MSAPETPAGRPVGDDPSTRAIYDEARRLGAEDISAVDTPAIAVAFARAALASSGSGPADPPTNPYRAVADAARGIAGEIADDRANAWDEGYAAGRASGTPAEPPGGKGRLRLTFNDDGTCDATVSEVVPPAPAEPPGPWIFTVTNVTQDRQWGLHAHGEFTGIDPATLTSPVTLTGPAGPVTAEIEPSGTLRFPRAYLVAEGDVYRPTPAEPPAWDPYCPVCRAATCTGEGYVTCARHGGPQPGEPIITPESSPLAVPPARAEPPPTAPSDELVMLRSVVARWLNDEQPWVTTELDGIHTLSWSAGEGYEGDDEPEPATPEEVALFLPMLAPALVPAETPGDAATDEGAGS